MTEKTHDEELDALKADITNLRKEIAALAAGVKRSAGTKAAAPDDEGAHIAAGKEAPDHVEESHGVFADLLHKFDSSRIQSEKVVKDLASEVEQHPLVGIMAAFGLGYIIAKLWYQGTKQ